MKSLRPIYRVWVTAYYRWARADMQKGNRHFLPGMHPDLPHVVLRLAELENRA